MENDTAAHKGHFVVLDSLRGICAVVVFLFHVEGSAALHSIGFIRYGYLYVDFFFVLSGFVICANYGERLASGYSLTKFLTLRWGRLYPLAAFMLVLYLPIALSKASAGISTAYTAPSFFLSALLSQVWIPQPLGASLAWNPASWSISAEMWMYILFAIICRASGRRYPLVCGACILIAIPIVIVATDRYLAVASSIGAVARCVLGFSLGVLAYQAFERLRHRRLTAAAASWVELALAVIALGLVWVAGVGPLSLLCPPTFAITIIAFAFQRGCLSYFLAMRPFVFLGMLSYSIYMVHDFVIARFLNGAAIVSTHLKLPFSVDPVHSFALLPANGWYYGVEMAIPLLFVAVIAFSYVTYTFIELPCRDFTRRIVQSSQSKVYPAT